MLGASPHWLLPMSRQAHVPRAGKQGFTLAEVMVAAAIMAAAIVGMIQVVITGSEMLDVSRKQTVAMQIIHAEIDGVRLSSWTTVNALPTASTSVSINSSLQAVS